jgi:spore maturation protein CgeB
VRIAIVDAYYPRFLADVYGSRPALEAQTYAVQHAALLDLGFGTGDSYSFYMTAFGHEAVDLIVNAEPLQERWAAERGALHGALRLARATAKRSRGVARRLASKDLQRRIARLQIREFDADLVYCHSLALFSRRDLNEMRGEGRLVVGQIASPLPAARLVEGFDLIVTSFPHFVTHLRRRGVDAEYLPLAIDTRVVDRLRARGFDPTAGSHRPYDVSFVGGVDPSLHRLRTSFLEELCARRPVDFWGYGAEALEPDSPIRDRHHGTAWGLEMYEALTNTRVAVNRHIDVAAGYANNMRLYEATGMGAMLLTDAGANLTELFDVGSEIAAYGSLDDAVMLLDHYLAAEPERRRIAAAGQDRTLTEHNFRHRIEQLLALLEPRVDAVAPKR